METNNKQRVVGINFNRWNERSEVIDIEFPYHNLDRFDDIFIYLCPESKGGVLGLGLTGKPKPSKPVAYAKFKATDFAKHDPEL